MTRNFLGLLIIAIGLAAGAAGAAPFQLATAPEGGPRAIFTFETGETPGGARLETERAGVAGSRVMVRVDRSPVPIVDHLLTPRDCNFSDDGGASRCAIDIQSADPAYAVLVESFQLGRTAHVEVATGGVMDMAHSVSLTGFTRALGR